LVRRNPKATTINVFGIKMCCVELVRRVVIIKDQKGRRLTENIADKEQALRRLSVP
jgi:hypothetical protein